MAGDGRNRRVSWESFLLGGPEVAAALRRVLIDSDRPNVLS